MFALWKIVLCVTHNSNICTQPQLKPHDLPRQNYYLLLLTDDCDQDLILTWIAEGFRIVSYECELRPAEATNYKSATGPYIRDKV